jgi:hypothetical protein
MNPFDNSATIPTLSAFGGSVIGALISTLSAWIGQRQRERRELVANKVSQLEQLFRFHQRKCAAGGRCRAALARRPEHARTNLCTHQSHSSTLLDRSDRERRTADCDYSQGLYRAEPHSRGNSVGGEQAQRSPPRIQQCVPGRTRIIREEFLTTIGRLRPRPPSPFRLR